MRLPTSQLFFHRDPLSLQENIFNKIMSSVDFDFQERVNLINDKEKKSLEEKLSLFVLEIKTLPEGHILCAINLLPKDLIETLYQRFLTCYQENVRRIQLITNIFPTKENKLKFYFKNGVLNLATTLQRNSLNPINLLYQNLESYLPQLKFIFSELTPQEMERLIKSSSCIDFAISSNNYAFIKWAMMELQVNKSTRLPGFSPDELLKYLFWRALRSCATEILNWFWENYVVNQPIQQEIFKERNDIIYILRDIVPSQFSHFKKFQIITFIWEKSDHAFQERLNSCLPSIFSTVGMCNQFRLVNYLLNNCPENEHPTLIDALIREFKTARRCYINCFFQDADLIPHCIRIIKKMGDNDLKRLERSIEAASSKGWSNQEMLSVYSSFKTKYLTSELQLIPSCDTAKQEVEENIRFKK